MISIFLLKNIAMELILKYFPNLSAEQINQFKQLEPLYNEWNSKINVISRKDISELYLKHILHALAIAKVVNFNPKTKLLDVGTGGGFPGIPLAILYPEVKFHLIDSINKKLIVVNEVATAIGLNNIKTTHIRAEQITDTYDFIISRAVTTMPTFVSWVKGKIAKPQNNTLKNGILYLKGGDLTEELKPYKTVTEYSISNFFNEPFFETKKVIHLPLKYGK